MTLSEGLKEAQNEYPSDKEIKDILYLIICYMRQKCYVGYSIAYLVSSRYNKQQVVM